MHTFCFSTFGAVKILEIDQIHRLWLLLCRSLYSSLASFELVEWQAKQPTTTTDLIKTQVPLPGQSLLQCLHFDSRFHGKSIQSVKSIFFPLQPNNLVPIFRFHLPPHVSNSPFKLSFSPVNHSASALSIHNPCMRPSKSSLTFLAQPHGAWFAICSHEPFLHLWCCYICSPLHLCSLFIV